MTFMDTAVQCFPISCQNARMSFETVSFRTSPMKSPHRLIFSSKSRHSRFIFVLLISALILPSLMADDDKLKTGKALETAMMTNVTWSSAGDSLGDQLRDLQEHSGVAILRDRRMDPHQPVNLTAVSVSRIQLMRQISNAIPEGACCLTNRMMVIGPAAAISRLPILLQWNDKQLEQLRTSVDAAAFRKMNANRDCSWEMLAEPRQILIQHAKSAGLTLRNPLDVPHDVWPAARLPEMSFMELATTILNQFDLTVNVDSAKPELVIVPINPLTKLQHRFLIPPKIKSRITETWNLSSPGLTVKWSGANAVVTAPLEQLAVLNAMLEELRFTDSSGAGPGGKASSIRTRSFLLKAESSTVGQLVEYFRTNRIAIEVINEDSPETAAIFKQVVRLADLTDKLPGTEFFPHIFSKYFRKVEVLDDRVILSN